MAINEERSYTEYNVEVPTTDFPIGFDILDDGLDVVAVTLNDVDPTTLGYTVTQVNNTTYRFAPAVPSGVVRLTRITDIDQMAHVFTEGAIFISENMDGNFKQIRHAQQEVRDSFDKLKDDIGFTNLEETVEAVGQIYQGAVLVDDSIKEQVILVQNISDDIDEQSIVIQGYANTASTASVLAETAATDATTQVGTLKTYVDDAVGAISTDASKQYATLALANADIANIALNKNIFVSEAVNGGYWYKATAGATSLTRSPYDPLTQAKADATAKANAVEQQLLINAFGRYGSSKNLVKLSGNFTSSSPTKPVVANWTSARDNRGETIAVNGLFAAVKLDVLGASYPDVYNDLSVFNDSNTSLRIQLFNNGSTLATLPLTRIAKTDAWYFWDKSLTYAAVNEIKIFASPKEGVTLDLSNLIIQNDGGIGNCEIGKRDEAIASSTSTLSESAILSNAYGENLLDDNSITTSTTAAQLEKAMTTPMSKYSAVCILDCDGVYPTTNSSTEGFKARIEIRDSNASYKAAFLKRIGNSKVWYVSDADASHPTPQSVKIYAVVPAGSTSVTIKNAVITSGSIPNPLQMLIRLATSASELTPIITPIVGQKVEEAVNALDVKQYPMTAIDAIRQAETRRVDIVTIGDSNNQHSGYGFEGALRNALTAKYGLYATGIVQGVAFGSASGAPNELSALSVANVPYNYLADGAILAASSANGLNIDPTKLYMFDTGKQLRFHASYGTFNSGGGSFRAGVRLGAAPYSVLQMGSLINTNTGQFSRQITSFDIAADPTRTGKSVEFKYAIPSQTQITGPFISYFMRVEDPNANSGICVSTIYSVGGQNLWNMATRLLTDTNAQLTTFFSEIRRLQLSKNQKPIVVIYINSALNDRNGTNTSLGWRASAVGDSPTAYIDNLEVITKRISDVWQMNGWDEAELFFWIVPSHPVSTPDDSELLAFRKAAYSFCQNRIRTSFTDFTNFVSEAEMTANDWYILPSDHNHLKKAGYDALINLITDSF